MHVTTSAANSDDFAALVLPGGVANPWPSPQTDIRNAGGSWVDQEVVVDGNLVTSRKPDDLSAFTQKMVDAVGAG